MSRTFYVYIIRPRDGTRKIRVKLPYIGADDDVEADRIRSACIRMGERPRQMCDVYRQNPGGFASLWGEMYIRDDDTVYYRRVRA